MEPRRCSCLPRAAHAFMHLCLMWLVDYVQLISNARNAVPDPIHHDVSTSSASSFVSAAS